MARRREAEKREILPDPKFNDILVARFINNLLKRGKKSLAERVTYTALDNIGEKVPGEQPLDVFKKAIENAAPVLEVRSRRVGGATYQVPVEVSRNRRLALSIRWLILNSKARAGKSMADKLTSELLDAYNNTGGAVRKKEDVHRMAEANKAFAHYRW
ncbi:MAG: 30S ribosomal protein S7 [Nitrospinaceae bacterium]|nr:30S ribosomal protein S7 [Nitrospinaceae bacterium]NIR54540.1 30S ribosomal protein S7 [Nitrospinaceae bacterium]NIS84959.1 30S ribosomal protein S7 [Nitrospinaceae bacterium]NIT81773.1 30S ribosomal protein S7 [Nitrospinaceae bacterium]NIU44042.1 30S ribosomal protein S7 [Nitrospinaceae bacterium]